MLESNICADTDFYKFCHWLMYPKNMTNIYSYAESRKGAKFDHVKFFGLLPIIKDHLVGKVVTREKIEEAAKLVENIGGYKQYFNRAMWEYILEKYDGHLPIKIKAVPEGTVVGVSNALFTIECLDDLCVPLVGHVETLLTHMWAPTTVCTVSYNIKKNILKALEKSGTPELIDYCCHDFGFRGVSSYQSAYMLGMGHLVNMRGTDTTAAERAIYHYYDDDANYSRGRSVWATEHSVATSFGPGSGELEYFLHQLKNAPDDAILSIVCDSYNTMNFCKVVASNPEIMKLIIKRIGRTVFRPDSGDPKEIVNKILEILGGVFGYTYNEKGYKVLKHNVGVLQGDGMNYESITELYYSIMTNGWSADNLVVGSGGGLLQKWDRDTQRFAIKASYGEITLSPGIVKGFCIFKDPATAKGKDTKTSKKGHFKLVGSQERGFHTYSNKGNKNDVMFNSYVDNMETLFDSGLILGTHKFETIVNRGL